MGYLITRLRAVFTVQRGGLTFNFADWSPTFTARSREVSAGVVAQDWTWNAPAEWGDGGSGSRTYRVQTRVGASRAAVQAARWPGGIGAAAASPAFEINPAQVGGFVQLRIRAINGAGARNPATGWHESPITEVQPVFVRVFGREFGREFA